MRARHALLAILIAVSSSARAQVVPAATGPGGIPVSGMLRYDLRYTQSARFYNGSAGDTQTAALSGDVTYANSNAAHPTSLTYTGGDMWTISGASYGEGVFQHLLVSQGYVRRAWSFSLKDDVYYMPQAPSGGFSGIPGIGDLPGAPSEQTILTLNTRSVNNTVSPVFTRAINHATSLSVNSSYETLRFPDGNGLDVDSVMGGAQLTRRLNALNSFSAQYMMTHISYPSYTTLTMGTQSAIFGYQRTWNRRFNTNASAGPQWVQSSESALIPSSLGLTVNASASYKSGLTTATLSYTQGASGGSGVSTQIGVHNQVLNAVVSRPYGRNVTISGLGSYIRTKGLNQAGVTNGEDGGMSVTRRLGRNYSVYANYMVTRQTTSAVLTANAVSGISQVISFGIGYTPRERHFNK